MSDSNTVNEILSKIPQFPYMKNEECVCPICRDNITKGTNIRMLPCGHIYCPDCIRRALENSLTCPVCRASPQEKIDEIESYVNSVNNSRNNSRNNSQQHLQRHVQQHVQQHVQPTTRPPRPPPALARVLNS